MRWLVTKLDRMNGRVLEPIIIEADEPPWDELTVRVTRVDDETITTP